jgi:AraC family transcriptional activator FtrA
MSHGHDHLVVAVAYDGLCTFEFGCTAELFALDRPELEVAWYRFEVCSMERGPLRAAGGISIVVDHDLDALDRADTIVVPGWRDADERPPDALLSKLRAAHARGARICSICSGVFVLAAAGILAGKKVTTHWRYAEKLAARYPELTVDAQALYVDEGRILTSAGSAAGLDMFLHLVRRDYGARVANQVAQRLVIPPHRDGGQAQYLPRPLPMDERGRLSKLMDFVRSNPAKPHTLASLAERAAMSPRTLQRQFQDTVGLPPHEWVVRARVGIAKDLLETSHAPLQRIADQAGFGSIESFRRHFRRVVGVSPIAYRRQFALDRRPANAESRAAAGTASGTAAR